MGAVCRRAGRSLWDSARFGGQKSRLDPDTGAGFVVPVGAARNLCGASRLDCRSSALRLNMGDDGTRYII